MYKIVFFLVLLTTIAFPQSKVIDRSDSTGGTKHTNIFATPYYLSTTLLSHPRIAVGGWVNSPIQGDLSFDPQGDVLSVFDGTWNNVIPASTSITWLLLTQAVRDSIQRVRGVGGAITDGSVTWSNLTQTVKDSIQRVRGGGVVGIGDSVLISAYAYSAGTAGNANNSAQLGGHNPNYFQPAGNYPTMSVGGYGASTEGNLSFDGQGGVLSVYNGGTWQPVVGYGQKGQVTFDDNGGRDSLLGVGNSCNIGLDVRSSDIVMCTAVGSVTGTNGYSSLNVNDIISVTVYPGYFVIQRKPGGTPFLKVNWAKL
jgi:hypothetical protein